MLAPMSQQISTKICSKCGEDKSIEAYSRQANRKDGRAGDCKICARARVAKWEKENREHCAAQKSAYYQATKERVAARNAERESREPGWKARYDAVRRAANGSKIVQQVAEWRRRNPEKYKVLSNRHNAVRRASKRRAMPEWADRAAISVVYAEAIRLSAAFGMPFHVDHIVPLNSKQVCGLHWEHNLQILVASENHKKSARFDPDQKFC